MKFDSLALIRKVLAFVSIVVLMLPLVSQPLSPSYSDTEGKFATAVGSPNKWKNPSNALGSSDNKCASTSGANVEGVWKVTGFTNVKGIIDGIVVKFKVAQSNAGQPMKAYVGTASGSFGENRDVNAFVATACNKTVVNAGSTVGSSSDKWGVEWNANDIKTNGILVKLVSGPTSNSKNLDSIEVTVYYTPNNPPTIEFVESTITIPIDSIEIKGNGNPGADVNFDVDVSDPDGDAVTVSCDPAIISSNPDPAAIAASGPPSLGTINIDTEVPTGNATITCTATDTNGASASASMETSVTRDEDWAEVCFTVGGQRSCEVVTGLDPWISGSPFVPVEIITDGTGVVVFRTGTIKTTYTPNESDLKTEFAKPLGDSVVSVEDLWILAGLDEAGFVEQSRSLDSSSFLCGSTPVIPLSSSTVFCNNASATTLFNTPIGSYEVTNEYPGDGTLRTSVKAGNAISNAISVPFKVIERLAVNGLSTPTPGPTSSGASLGDYTVCTGCIDNPRGDASNNTYGAAFGQLILEPVQEDPNSFPVNTVIKGAGVIAGTKAAGVTSFTFEWHEGGKNGPLLASDTVAGDQFKPCIDFGITSSEQDCRVYVVDSTAIVRDSPGNVVGVTFWDFVSNPRESNTHGITIVSNSQGANAALNLGETVEEIFVIGGLDLLEIGEGQGKDDIGVSVTTVDSQTIVQYTFGFNTPFSDGVTIDPSISFNRGTLYRPVKFADGTFLADSLKTTTATTVFAGQCTSGNTGTCKANYGISKNGFGKLIVKTSSPVISASVGSTITVTSCTNKITAASPQYTGTLALSVRKYTGSGDPASASLGVATLYSASGDAYAGLGAFGSSTCPRQFLEDVLCSLTARPNTLVYQTVSGSLSCSGSLVGVNYFVYVIENGTEAFTNTDSFARISNSSSSNFQISILFS
jgi:hypothetical protein